MADDNEQEATSLDDRSDAAVLAELGLDANLQPISETPTEEPEDETEEVDDQESPAADTEESESESASGENAGDEDETAGEQEPEEDEGTSEETEGDQEAENQPKGIRDMQKRIDKLTAMRRELEEENASLKGQLGSAKHPTLTATPEDPLSDLDSEEAIEERVDQMQTYVSWCYENLEGGEMEIKGKTVELSGKEVRHRLARAQEVINRHAPARRKYLQDRAGYDSYTRKVYPALFDPKSVESQIANTFLRVVPAIVRAPNYQLIIGDAIYGGKDRMAKQKQAEAKPKKESIAPRTIKPAQPAQKLGSKANGRAPQLKQRFHESGKVSDLAAFIETTL